jgi:hypothetical protein
MNDDDWFALYHQMETQVAWIDQELARWWAEIEYAKL